MREHMRYNINWKKTYAKVGDKIPIYPFFSASFIGVVEKVRTNKYGRVSYVVDGKEFHAEELMPAKNQEKLRMRAVA